MKVIRSSKCTTKYMTAEKRLLLDRVLREYSTVVNAFIDYFLALPVLPHKMELLKPIVDQPETWLTARLRLTAAREALDAIVSTRAGCEERRSQIVRDAERSWKAGKVHQYRKFLREAVELKPIKPRHYGNTMQVSSNIANLVAPKAASEFDAWLEIRCVGQKIAIDIPIRLHEHFNSLTARGERLAAYVISRDWVQFVFEIETGPKRGGGRVVGIDTGIKSLATLSTGEKLGTDMEALVARINRCQHGSNGQKRARRALRQRMDEVAGAITSREDIDIVVVEKLKGLGFCRKVRHRLTKNMRRAVGAWAYSYWIDRLRMKTEDDRVGFRSVLAWNTSITCSRCGLIDRSNRQSQSVFLCRRCGHTGDADVLASENIARRFLTGLYGAGCQLTTGTVSCRLRLCRTLITVPRLNLGCKEAELSHSMA